MSKNVYAQSPFDSYETGKLLDFLLQESAEAGIRNYQQLGVDDIRNVNWADLGLEWENRTYLFTSLKWRGKKLAGNLDLSGFKELKIVYCENNSLSKLDVTDCPNIIYLDCYGNNIKSLDLSTNVNLRQIGLRYNFLTELDLSNNNQLTFVCCTGNNIDSLNLSGLKLLETLYCIANKLNHLNLKDCDRLMDFKCTDNNLTYIDISNKRYLSIFSCARNNISEINLANCPALSSFDCNDNVIPTLDFTGCLRLSSLQCNDNILKEINIEDCTSLKELNCNNNLLESLKIPDSTTLEILQCKNNNLDFFSLPRVAPHFKNYVYGSQNIRYVDAYVDEINLSDFFIIDGFFSRYLWFEDVNLLEPEIINDGVFRFEDNYINKLLTCRIQNQILPNLVLRYDVTLKVNDVSNISPEKNAPCVYASDGYIHVVTVSSEDVCIYSMQGALLMRKIVENGRTDIPIGKGLYVVAVGNSNGRVLSVR